MEFGNSDFDPDSHSDRETDDDVLSTSRKTAKSSKKPSEKASSFRIAPTFELQNIPQSAKDLIVFLKSSTLSARDKAPVCEFICAMYDIYNAQSIENNSLKETNQVLKTNNKALQSAINKITTMASTTSAESAKSSSKNNVVTKVNNVSIDNARPSTSAQAHLPTQWNDISTDAQRPGDNAIWRSIKKKKPTEKTNSDQNVFVI